MSSRKQHTKQFNSFTFERIDALFEISKIQSIIKISIRFIFEFKSSFSQSMTNVQNVVFLSKNVNMIDDVIDQNDFIEQIKQKLTIIKMKKKTCSFETQINLDKNEKKKTDFSVIVFEISKWFRKNVEL